MIVFRLYILLLVLIGFSTDLCAQEKQRTIKLYQHVDVFELEVKRFIPQNNNQIVSLYRGYAYNAGRRTVAFSWGLKNNYFNEVQLSFSKLPAIDHPYITRFSKSSDLLRIYGSIGYELDRLLNDKSQPVHYYLGACVALYSYSIREMPLRDYMTMNQNFGIVYRVVPKVSLKLSKRMKLDFGLILSLLDLRHHNFIFNNPQISNRPTFIEKQTKVVLLPKYFGARVGLSYHVRKHHHSH